MALDAKNNLYIADRGNNRIVVVSPSGAVTTPFARIPAPSGVAVDAKGNVVVTGNDGLTYEQPTQGAYKATLVASNFTTPYGVAFDATGNMYIDDDGAQQVILQTPMTAAVNFGNVWSNNFSATQNLLFVFDSPAVLGAPAVYSLVNGIKSPDFASQPTSTCAPNQYFLAGQTCIAAVAFKYPSIGTVNGTIVLGSNANTVLGWVPVTGTAVLPSSGGCALHPMGKGVNPMLMCF
jgi:hypothetical protein